MHIEAGQVVTNGIGLTTRYFLVSDFHAADKGHWLMVRQMAKSIPVDSGQALLAIFLDLSQYYEPSPIGEKVGAPYQHRTIAQYVVTSGSKALFFTDPFGFGNYIEPGDIPNDFGI